MRLVKQPTFRIADRPGRLAEVASTLWQQRVHIQAFAADLHEGQGTFHLVVDKVAVAKKTFIENGWEAAEEDVRVLTPANKPWKRRSDESLKVD